MTKETGDKILDTLVTEVAEDNPIDYSTMTKDQLFEELGQAYANKNMKLMGKLSTLVAKAEASEAKDAKDKLLEALVSTTQETLADFTKLARKLVDSGKLDGGEGIWFAWDFGSIEEQGINPALRLMKGSRKASTGGEGSGSSSYTAGLPPTKEMLDKVGDHIYFSEDTTVTVDKVEVVMLAGTTYKQAYDYSTNGGWRNRVRMAVGKECGLVGKA